ncbi:MAG: acyltransferase family protein [Myxococcota bacterium]
MFGSLRFVLALLVVITHLGPWFWPGVYAVFGFYIISGYLMCLVLNRRYGFSPRGFRTYALNRFLRIFPPYWFACCLSVIVLAFVGPNAGYALGMPWELPPSWLDWVDNFSIVSLPTGRESRLVPPSWALRVELFYYALIGLGMGRSRRIALLWLLPSIGYHLAIWRTGSGWESMYFPIPAASLPFNLGALIYHFREEIPEALRKSLPLLGLAIALWMVNIVVGPTRYGEQKGPINFYLNVALVGVLVALLCRRKPNGAWWKKIENVLGDLSYPVYLVHMQIGVALVSLQIARPFNLQLVYVSLVPILLTSWAMLRFVDDPIEDMRSQVKRRFRERA